jgi:copper(I)-binding protein
VYARERPDLTNQVGCGTTLATPVIPSQARDLALNKLDVRDSWAPATPRKQTTGGSFRKLPRHCEMSAGLVSSGEDPS